MPKCKGMNCNKVTSRPGGICRNCEIGVFRANAEHCAAIAETWPAWKKNILGRIEDDDEAVSDEMKVCLLNDINLSFPDMPVIAASMTRGVAPNNACNMKHPSKMLLLQKLVRLGHMSPFEHSSTTFHIENVSRACLDQLNRYRIASICMESLRHVNVSARPSRIPDSISDPQLRNSVTMHIAATNELYEKLIGCGVPVEDARSLIEMGRLTQEIFTVNLREFMWVRRERLCVGAQHEIRKLVQLMSEKLLLQCPEIDVLFAMPAANPPCDTCNKCRKKALTLELKQIR